MVLGLLRSMLGRRLASNEDVGASGADVGALAERARGEGVTPAVLRNDHDRSARPLVVYLEDGEQPEYVLRGGELLIGDAKGALAREHPTRELQVVISDRRLLFVLGMYGSDELWEVPFADVEDVYLDADSTRQHVVVDADREGAAMTFFADVTLDGGPAEPREAVSFVEATGTSSE